MEVISRFRGDGRWRVAEQVSSAWGAFDTEEYAREVLAAGAWDEVFLTATTQEQLKALRLVPQVRLVYLTGSHADLTPLVEVPEVERVSLYGNLDLTDLSPLASLPQLKWLHLNRCSLVRDLTPVARPGLERIALTMLHPDLCLAPLREADDLTAVSIGHPALIESLRELPLGPRLTTLVLQRQIRYASLDGIDRWPLLTELTLAGQSQLRELCGMPDVLGRLTYLGLRQLDPLDLGTLTNATRLQSLSLGDCTLPDGLGPLRELPRLSRVSVFGAATGAPLDLSPLADLPGLTLQVPDDMPLIGADRIPPERLRRTRTRP